MTPKQWNLGLGLSMLMAVALVGTGVGFMAGLGAGLLAAGLAIFACLGMASAVMMRRLGRAPESD